MQRSQAGARERGARSPVLRRMKQSALRIKKPCFYQKQGFWASVCLDNLGEELEKTALLSALAAGPYPMAKRTFCCCTSGPRMRSPQKIEKCLTPIGTEGATNML